MSRALSVCHGRFGRATLYELDRPMTLHAHREGHLIFHRGGSPGCVEVSGRAALSTLRTAAAVGPWESHGFTPASTASGQFLVLYINPSWFQEIGAGHSRSLRFGVPEVPLTPAIDRLADRVSDLLAAQRTPPGFERMLFELTELCRVQSWWTAVAGVPACEPVPLRTDFRVRKSMRILTERLAEGPDLDRVARDSGLSRPHFYKLFKQQVGITPSLYLNTLRMERAVIMVAGAERSITDIGEDLGFSSQSVFTRFSSRTSGCRRATTGGSRACLTVELLRGPALTLQGTPKIILRVMDRRSAGRHGPAGGGSRGRAVKLGQ